MSERPWRLSKSLDKLRSQVNAAVPGRSKASDGTKGDDAHAARKSDHNPDSEGIVRALDITHDPKNGVDSEKLAEALRLSRDPRISYIISNRKIAASYAVHGEAAWTWRTYSGANPHNKHCHISVVADDGLADDARPWAIEAAFAAKPVPDVVTQKPIVQATDRRSRMGAVILGYEARRDSKGRLLEFAPPANDGGGSYEVGGINVKYHPAQAAYLRDLLRQERYDEAEVSALEYIVKYTDAAAGWSTNAGVEFFLRDCVFNRGPTGAAKILQMALGVGVDGKVGQETRDALAKIEPGALLEKLRAARERYEDMVAPGRPNLRAGLVNRWNKALADAKKFAAETPTTTQKTTGQAGAGAAGGVVAGTATAAANGAWTWVWIGLGVLALIAIGYVAYRYVWPWWKARRANLPELPTAADIRDLFPEAKPATAERLPAPEFVKTATKPAPRAPRKPAAKPKGKTKQTTKKRKAA